MSTKLHEIIEALIKREEKDWAEACAWLLPLEPMINHGYSYEEILNMTIEEIEVLMKTPQKPLKYENWNFWWGQEAWK